MFSTTLNEGGKPPTAKAGSQRRLDVVLALSFLGVEPSRLLSGSVFSIFWGGPKYGRHRSDETLLCSVTEIISLIDTSQE